MVKSQFSKVALFYDFRINFLFEKISHLMWQKKEGNSFSVELLVQKIQLILLQIIYYDIY